MLKKILGLETLLPQVQHLSPDSIRDSARENRRKIADGEQSAGQSGRRISNPEILRTPAISLETPALFERAQAGPPKATSLEEYLRKGNISGRPCRAPEATSFPES